MMKETPRNLAIDGIEFRHVERCSLDPEILARIAKKFVPLVMPVVVSFDRQISDHGFHNILTDDDGRSYHYIRLSTRTTEHLDAKSQRFEILSTYLHELCHANQFEKLGPTKFSGKEYCNASASTRRIAEYYAPKEIEARAFENSQLLAALRFYDEQARTKIPTYN